MTVYSHSRISTYENCPYQYKLKYIDKVKVDVLTTIEAFMGDIVHQTLEHLYKLKKFNKRVALNVLIKFYRELWDKKTSIVINPQIKLKFWNYYKNKDGSFFWGSAQRYLSDEITLKILIDLKKEYDKLEGFELKEGDKIEIILNKLKGGNRQNE